MDVEPPLVDDFSNVINGADIARFIEPIIVLNRVNVDAYNAELASKRKKNKLLKTSTDAADDDGEQVCSGFVDCEWLRGLKRTWFVFGSVKLDVKMTNELLPPSLVGDIILFFVSRCRKIILKCRLIESRDKNVDYNFIESTLSCVVAVQLQVHQR